MKVEFFGGPFDGEVRWVEEMTDYVIDWFCDEQYVYRLTSARRRASCVEEALLVRGKYVFDRKHESWEEILL